MGQSQSLRAVVLDASGKETPECWAREGLLQAEGRRVLLAGGSVRGAPHVEIARAGEGTVTPSGVFLYIGMAPGVSIPWLCAALPGWLEEIGGNPNAALLMVDRASSEQMQHAREALRKLLAPPSVLSTLALFVYAPRECGVTRGRMQPCNAATHAKPQSLPHPFTVVSVSQSSMLISPSNPNAAAAQTPSGTVQPYEFVPLNPSGPQSGAAGSLETVLQQLQGGTASATCVLGINGREMSVIPPEVLCHDEVPPSLLVSIQSQAGVGLTVGMVPLSVLWHRPEREEEETVAHRLGLLRSCNEELTERIHSRSRLMWACEKSPTLSLLSQDAVSCISLFLHSPVLLHSNFRVDLSELSHALQWAVVHGIVHDQRDANSIHPQNHQTPPTPAAA